MYRWVAYIGQPIFLEDVLVKPSHSLLRQSRFAEENIVKGNPHIPDGPFPTNDDGQTILPTAAKLLVSEPLSEEREHWEEIPEQHFISVFSRGKIALSPLSII